MKIAKLFVLFVAAAVWLPLPEPARAASFKVQMTDGLVFSPSSLSIARGDSVIWTNVGTLRVHTSTSGSPPGTPDGLWNSDNLGSHAAFTLATASLNPNSYPYFCSLHFLNGMTGTLTITNAPNTPPSISITNPVAGVKLRAPTNIVLMADANDTDGSVTNVQFFSGATLLGGAASAPYSFTVSNAAAGNYSFSAIAVDNLGAATTSAVVNVFVLTNATLTAPTHLANGQFQFTVLGISGQTYATEASSNLTSWSALSTNVAPSDTFDVVDPSATNAGLRFYRARQDF